VPDRSETANSPVFVVEREDGEGGFEPIGVFASEDDANAAVEDGFGRRVEPVPFYESGAKWPEMVTIWWAEARPGGEIVVRSFRVESGSIEDVGDDATVVSPGEVAVGRDREATIAALR
jgi:hypothetical protein